VPIGRIGGVVIRVHVTFLVLVVLVAASAGAVGETVPEAVGWLLILFGCVVLHELAHAAVARHQGIDVHEIDLLPIGGVSRMERIPDAWRDEAAIAVAGPLASTAIGVVALAVAAVVGPALWPPSPWEGPLLARIGWVNLLLAGFNLIPAFPLDGGRVMRALLERTRSRVDATRQAARLSRILAFAMIAVGLFWNIWLVLIGIFVLFAGRSEETAVLIHAALAVPARALSVACPIELPGAMAAGAARAGVAGTPQVAYPVRDERGQLTGVVAASTLEAAPAQIEVARLVSHTIVDADEPLDEVAEAGFSGPVAVVSGPVLVGVITPSMLEGYLTKRMHDLDR
jgi:stage IV sporulation protein FB